MWLKTAQPSMSDNVVCERSKWIWRGEHLFSCGLLVEMEVYLRPAAYRSAIACLDHEPRILNFDNAGRTASCATTGREASIQEIVC
jgi:hypothetical protein